MKTVNATLNAVPFNAFSGCFMQNLEKYKKCVAGMKIERI
jgi:hypothetical protein